MTELKINDLKDILSQSIRWTLMVKNLGVSEQPRPLFFRIYLYYINCYPHWTVLSTKMLEWLANDVKT